MKPSKHDHVGHMTFSETRAICHECGAEWRTDKRGKWFCVVAGVA